MHRPLTVATIVALSSIAHAQTAANPAPAQPQYSVDGTLIPADYFANQAPRGVGPGPVSTAFTYQGFLENGGAPANAAFDMTFVLLDDLGTVVAGPTCIDNVAVSAGIFTVQLDFGAQFDGRARRLGIAVRPGGPVGDCANPGGYTALTPAQPITATPYALGLRLPFEGNDVFDGASLTIRNGADISDAAGIRGISTGTAAFAFGDRAGVRGESNSFIGAGVLGISETYAGVIGYTAQGTTGVFGRADGENANGVRGWVFGNNSRAVVGEDFGTDGWAGYFVGRGYFSGNLGIGTDTPEAALDVVGNIRTNGLRISDNAGAGRTLVSDPSGNANWTATNTAFVSGGAPAPAAPIGFISPTASIAISEGQKIHVTVHRAFGSTFAAGADSLNIFVGYRVAGSGAVPTNIGAGIFGLRCSGNTRQTYSISGIITGLPAGTYEVGMSGTDNGNGQWNNNEFGYVSAFTLN